MKMTAELFEERLKSIWWKPMSAMCIHDYCYNDFLADIGTLFGEAIPTDEQIEQIFITVNMNSQKVGFPARYGRYARAIRTELRKIVGLEG